MRIVFMGTPDYSVGTLAALKNAGHEIVGVFAQPDKPVGRKHILTPPPVKVFAEENGIPVYQPNTLRDGSALEIIKQLQPELMVVVAYGKILPQEILDYPKYGCINGHASLLPKYRGASPIQWCIVCGEKETGITIMKMDAGMDTGDIISSVTVPIGEEETAEELFDRLADISADLTVDTVAQIQSGTATYTKQPDGATYAPILKKEMALLDFSKSADELHNAVRGYYSWPCAYFFLGGKRVKVLESRVDVSCNAVAGTLFVKNENLLVACGDGKALRLVTVQPEGGKAMSAAQWLNGHAELNGSTVDAL